MTIAELNTLFAAYEAAMEAEDYSTAERKLHVMRARLASTANVSRSLADGGSQSITYNGVNIDQAIKDCRQLKTAAIHASSAPFQQIPIQYARTTPVDDFS